MVKDENIQSAIGEAVRTTHRGGAVFGPHIAGKVLDELSRDRRGTLDTSGGDSESDPTSLFEIHSHDS